MPEAPRQAAGHVSGGLREHARGMSGPFDLAAIVSLAVLVVSPRRVGVAAAVALALLAAAVVVIPAVRRSPWPWAGFAAFHVATYASHWYRLDNHDALAAYWAVALTIAAASRHRDRLLAMQARFMLGLTFLLATLWKLLSGQFLSGDFFTFALLVDPRFRSATELVAGVPVDQVHRNVMSLSAASNALQPGQIPLIGADAVAVVAMVLTVATVVVEAMVAAVMLLPGRFSRQWWRSGALAMFLVGTYVIVPVSRFGVLLAAMGVAEASGRPRLRAGFAVGAGLLIIWGSVWKWLVGLG